MSPQFSTVQVAAALMGGGTNGASLMSGGGGGALIVIAPSLAVPPIDAALIDVGEQPAVKPAAVAEVPEQDSTCMYAQRPTDEHMKCSQRACVEQRCFEFGRQVLLAHVLEGCQNFLGTLLWSIPRKPERRRVLGRVESGFAFGRSTRLSDTILTLIVPSMRGSSSVASAAFAGGIFLCG